MHKKISEPKFVVDQKGKRTQVLLNIKEYQALIEELEDRRDAMHAEKIIKKTKKVYPLAAIEQKLRRQEFI